MAFSESLDVYFRLKSDGGLADPGTFNGATPVAVLFDNPYRAEFEVGSTDPSPLGKASDFPVGNGSIGKTLLVNSITYTIKAREPVDDGQVVRLQLEAP